MASQTNSYTVSEVAIGYPVTPSSATPPRCGWWSRPIVTMPATYDPNLIPCFGGIFTFIAVFVLIFYFINEIHCHAKFAIRSIAVSPSSATWHVDFLVKNPSYMYTIYYGVGETALKLGAINAAVLSTSHKRISRHYTAFSVDFVAGGNPIVLEQLDIKLKAKEKAYVGYDAPGHIDIRCYNLTPSHENVNIQCKSSFTELTEV
ncbi:hypothetical protein ISN45_At05g020530 [Arabidopsis thaliana x Arabidopsis arenosa]|uniref:Late embryogenesis abundant protein LEA-2 subgroup domain-containing protein n=2 Tax=Arabidopsis TaxID=3701 RepID=A0A178UMA2_ARATH|nr:hypothetical protein ISN45_At05g020530 [Arabidopsis thaliana x Arabidopsis arenosa]OAO94968.1 hypothetical protein AXX17_AT5G21500 [Arabidopsis thaliana]